MLIKAQKEYKSAIFLTVGFLISLLFKLYYEFSSDAEFGQISFWLLWLCFFISGGYLRDVMSPYAIVFLIVLIYFFTRTVALYYGDVQLYFYGYGGRVVALDYINSFLIMYVGLLSFLAGQNYSCKFYKYNSIKHKSPNKNTAQIVAVVVTVLSITSFFYLSYRLGGVSTIILTQASIVKDIPSGDLMLRLSWTIFNLYFIANALLLISRRIDKYWLAHLFLGIVMLLIFGRRGPLLMLILPFIMYLHIYKWRLSVPVAFFLITLMFLMFFSIVFYRISIAPSLYEVTPLYVFSSPEFFVWDMFMNVSTQSGELLDLRFGLDFLPAFVRDNLFSDSLSTFDSLGYGLVSIFLPDFQAGIPPTMFGVLYLNGLWQGIILGFLIFGFLFGYIRTVIYSKNSIYSYVLIYPIVLMILFYIMRLGDFWLVMSAYGRYLFFILLIYLIINKKIKFKY